MLQHLVEELRVLQVQHGELQQLERNNRRNGRRLLQLELP